MITTGGRARAATPPSPACHPEPRAITNDFADPLAYTLPAEDDVQAAVNSVTIDY